MKRIKNKTGLYAAVIGSLMIAAILILGTYWSGQKAQQDTVTSVSKLYLDELAGRREQVVSSALKRNIGNMQTAVSLLTKDDLSDIAHLQAYQQRVRQLYTLEKFAFVDTNGLIYTADGTMDDIEKYSFDYNHIREPEISVRDDGSGSKSVIIAVPVDRLPLDGKTLTVCFMEIDMNTMLEGVSLQSDNNNTTFCNIYTHDGNALTDMVLGGLASEDNLLEAVEHADFDDHASAEALRSDFENGKGGIVSFTYNDVKETLSYTPIDGTDWMLTYLIRESVISEKISSVSEGILVRSLVQIFLTALVILFMFLQNKKNAELAIEKETSVVKQEELEQRLRLQNELLEQEKMRTRQDHMITALASDYKSVYYVNLDSDECICYRSEVTPEERPQVGDRLSFVEAFTRYANEVVAESYRESFLQFIAPDNIRRRLEKETIIALRYLTVGKNGQETYEMLRMAGVRHAEDRDDHTVHAVGVGFTDIDGEMRESMAQSRALSDALAAAEQASKAKTSFLSSMSHEIRTPMNAIIGLNAIALNAPELTDKTRDYLEKIGSSANHLLSLINDILDMSRIESGKTVLKNEDFSFSKLLEQINTIFGAQCADKGLDYNCRIIGSVDAHYIGDNMKLQQVLINILGNAVKFTPEGGSVALTVERTAHFDSRSTLRLTISDTGIGMSSEYLPKLFETFSQEDSSATNRYGSSGLGMAITKNIVEIMNGNIEVQSEKGKGTTFIVTVTLMDSAYSESDPEDHDMNLGELSVLVIDDDPVACEHAKLVLGQAGIACETVLSGREAIELVRLRQARQQPFDLLLIDLKMPGMDGIETAREIRSVVGYETAIIIITAYKWDNVLEEAEAAGVDSFISKPLFADNVIEEFRSAYRKKDPAGRNTGHKAELKGRNILLAEDVPINAEIVKMVIAMREIHVDHAENGKTALEKFSASEVGHYDAVLMDVRMPEMDGLEAAAKIRALERADAKTVPIIAMTANAFDEDVQRSLQAGMNAHLSKPIDNDILFGTLESLIK
ncbi:hybrid sensor histidine kinase/response regulator [Ruminococcus albus]|uniref:Circadian input-output histidine kinase CikA n=1 Tax=Ruminococcus albus 8 TaxID=246199 RepID=E9SEI7_RUMAL|nr:hybrid sensor histidine kinase/response regulator [Ruminococcus albus]EGC02317.1 response regulator receiver domain protein [Ruminococcus albus 8]MCC3351660.1 response regulator [Ruminococcus albus 8]